MMTSSFMCLNKATLIPILTEWVTIPDLTDLDSAVCNIKIRETFVSLLADDMFVHFGDAKIHLKTYIDWLMFKNLKVKTLNLCVYITRPVSKLIDYLNRIKIINIRMDYCFNLVIILQKYKGLIDQLELCNRIMTDVEFEELLPFMKDLTFVGLGYSQITTASTDKIIENCPSLKNIATYHCKKLTPSHIIKMAQCYGQALTAVCPSELCSDLEMTAVLNMCPNLTVLNISGSKCSFEGLKGIGNCPNIVNLNIKRCALTDEGVSFIATKLKSLLYFTFGYHPNVTDASLMAIADNCSALQDIDMIDVHITDVGIKAIAEKCIKLEYINCDKCSDLTIEGLNSIYTNCKLIRGILYPGVSIFGVGNVLQFLSNTVEPIEAIRLFDKHLVTADNESQYNIYIHRPVREKRLTLVLQKLDTMLLSESILLSIIQTTPTLRSIYLGSQCQITNLTFDALMQHCPSIDAIHVCAHSNLFYILRTIRFYSTQLKKVSLFECKTLSTRSLIALLPHLINVTHLSITTCKGIIDTCFILIVDSCTKIRHLDISHTKSITNDSVKHLLLRLGPQLIHLNLCGTSVTHFLFPFIKAMCTSLRVLNISECEGIDATSPKFLGLVHDCDSLNKIEYTVNNKPCIYARMGTDS